MTICIIPARGGSQRIPKKNIKLFQGRPMIGYAIEAAQTSKLFVRIVVSTDDHEIADIACSLGADVPFIRAAELADGTTPTVTVIRDAIRQLFPRLGKPPQFDPTEVNAISGLDRPELNPVQAVPAQIDQTESNPTGIRDGHFSYPWNQPVCCLYPCVPLLRPQLLIDSLALFRQSAAPFCFPVLPFPAPIERSMRRDPDGLMIPQYIDCQLMPAQQLSNAWYDAGQFYWGTIQAWLTQTLIHAHAVGYPIARWEAIDIDHPDDWVMAEMIYQVVQQRF